MNHHLPLHTFDSVAIMARNMYAHRARHILGGSEEASHDFPQNICYFQSYVPNIFTDGQLKLEIIARTALPPTHCRYLPHIVLTTKVPQLRCANTSLSLTRLLSRLTY